MLVPIHKGKPEHTSELVRKCIPLPRRDRLRLMMISPRGTIILRCSSEEDLRHSNLEASTQDLNGRELNKRYHES